jgi:hypothetical protein
MCKIIYKDWEVDIKSKTLTVTKKDESREYDIPEEREIEVKDEYIWLTLKDGTLLQFKMEEDNFFVGDEFNKEGEHVDSIACHVFGEE